MYMSVLVINMLYREVLLLCGGRQADGQHGLQHHPAGRAVGGAGAGAGAVQPHLPGPGGGLCGHSRAARPPPRAGHAPG